MIVEHWRKMYNKSLHSLTLCYHYDINQLHISKKIKWSGQQRRYVHVGQLHNSNHIAGASDGETWDFVIF